MGRDRRVEDEVAGEPDVDDQTGRKAWKEGANRERKDVQPQAVRIRPELGHRASVRHAAGHAATALAVRPDAAPRRGVDIGQDRRFGGTPPRDEVTKRRPPPRRDRRRPDRARHPAGQAPTGRPPTIGASPGGAPVHVDPGKRWNPSGRVPRSAGWTPARATEQPEFGPQAEVLDGVARPRTGHREDRNRGVGCEAAERFLRPTRAPAHATRRARPAAGSR